MAVIEEEEEGMTERKFQSRSRKCDALREKKRDERKMEEVRKSLSEGILFCCVRLGKKARAEKELM